MFTIGQTADGDPISVPDYAILLKHHPTRANLHKDGTASREILPGDELLFDREDHPSRLLPDSVFSENIPLEDDYRIADEIIQDAIKTHLSGGAQRKRDSAGKSKCTRVVERRIRRPVDQHTNYHILFFIRSCASIVATNCGQIQSFRGSAAAHLRPRFGDAKGAKLDVL
jgi:hypothetical protein